MSVNTNTKNNYMMKLQRTCQNIYRFFTEKQKLRKENKRLRVMLKETRERNKLYQETLDEFYEYFAIMQAKKNTIKEEKVTVEKKAEATLAKDAPTMNDVLHTPLAEFQRYEPIKHEEKDEIAEKVQKMLHETQNTIGLNNQLKDGQLIKYKDLNLEEIDALFGYSLLNPSKEIKIKLDDNREALLETHPDKSTSISLYENNKHQRSVSTETKMIDGVETTQYNQDDLKKLLELFAKREEE